MPANVTDAQAAVTHVDTATNATDATLTLGSNTTVGNYLLVEIGTTGHNVGSVTPTDTTSAGGWNTGADVYLDPHGAGFFWKKITTAAACTVTLGKGGASTALNARLHELTNVDAAAFLDGAVKTSSGTGTSAALTMDTTTSATDELFTLVGGDPASAFTPGSPASGFADLTNLNNAATYTQLQTATQTPGTTLTTPAAGFPSMTNAGANKWGAVAFAVKGAVAVGAALASAAAGSSAATAALTTGANYELVQQASLSNAGGVASLAATFTRATTAGNHLKVLTACAGTDFANLSLSDGGLGSVFTLRASVTANGITLALYDVPNIAAGITAITASLSSGTSIHGVFAQECAGLAQTTPFLSAQTASAAAPGTATDALTTPSVSVSNVPAHLFAFACDVSATVGAGYPHPGTGFTTYNLTWLTWGGGSYFRALPEDEPVNSTGTYQATWTLDPGVASDTFAVIAAAFAVATQPPMAVAAALTSALSAGLATTLFSGTNAAATTACSATLISFVSVVLQAPLYTGIGGILDPNFWVDAVPVAGNTVWYDPTFVTIQPNGEIVSTSNNCQCAVQFNAG